MVSLERRTQAIDSTVACSDNATYTFLPFSSYRTKSHRLPWFQLLVDTVQKPPPQLAAAGSFSKSICGEAQKWLARDLLEVVSPQGQSTARKPFSSPLPSLHADDITRHGCLRSASTSSNSRHRSIPATHNQNYQAPSPTPPLKWKLEPRAFSLCEEGTDKQRQPWFPGRGERSEGSNPWLGRSDAWFGSALGLLCLHTFAQREPGRLQRALVARWRCDGDRRLLPRKWSRNGATCNCCLTHTSVKEMVLPPAPQIAEGQDTNHRAETDITILLFLKLVLALAAWYKRSF